MIRPSPRLLLALALLASVAQAQGPAKPDFPSGVNPNFPPKSRLLDERRSASELREVSAASSPESSSARVKFSDPAKPATVRVVLPMGEVRITGTDGDEVVVTSSLDAKGETAEVDADGFRRLDEEMAFELKEKDNVVSLALVGEHQAFGHGAEFNLRVPRRANVVVRSQLGGDIHISGVEGEIEVNGMNTSVNLTDIGTCAVVNTMNGEVVAKFRQTPTKPVSITSLNGEIDLQLPADAKANVRLRTHHGTVRTNFPDTVLVTKTERVTGRGAAAAAPIAPGDVRAIARDAERLAREVAAQVRATAQEHARVARAAAAAADAPEAPEPPDAPLPPLPPFGGRSIVGTLNGGGVEIALSSMNGSITLRSAR